ncbi:MAG: phenylpyruvate tautomerase MIF-related protein [Christensenellaceae bacterium]
MPFIDVKTNVTVTKEQRDAVKSKLGKAVSILKKPESYLMVGICDDYDLYFAGKPLERGAYVSVSLFGEPSADATEKMTGEICKVLKEVLSIPGESVYVTYHGVENWGWNGSNF